MKKYIKYIVLLFLVAIVYIYREKITVFYLENFTKTNKPIFLKEKNEYYLNYDFKYIKNIDDFNNISEYNDLLNAYYTIINSGIDSFTFYCPKEYKSCIDDVKSISNDQVTLANINSFVHPFNSFSNINTEYDSLGKVTLSIKKYYTEEQINKVNKKVDSIILSEIENITDKKEIIKKVHDYIINNSKYDSDKSDKNINNYFSNIAYGPLIQGYGLCGGYTDSMAIFLNRYNIPNFKVISENHIWNAVYIDNEWMHLDLTWDDPVVENGSNILEYNFFLINNSELENLETNEHVFNKDVFSELK